MSTTTTTEAQVRALLADLLPGDPHSSSKGYEGGSQPSEVVRGGPGQEPAPGGYQRCGITIVMRHSATGAGRVTQLSCKTKTCPTCGPRWREVRHRHYSEVLADAGPLHYSEVTREAWKRMRSRLREHLYLRVPLSEDLFALITTAPVGEPVDDLATLLTSVFADGMYLGGRVTSSAEWRLVTEIPDTGWEVVGITPAHADDVAAMLDGAGLLGARLGGLDAWEIVWPAEGDEVGSHRLARIWMEVGLRPPGARYSQALRAA